MAARDRYDTIIIGGGSAGCALARRLSSDPTHRVLVLEAGRPDSLWDLFIHMPAGLTVPLGNRFYDWRYASEPEPHMAGRRVAHARGKVLGGSSSINGMIFIRGNPMDYDGWAQADGMERWDYAHCLPYFKRMESRRAGADAYRGGDGPLILERGPCESPLFGAFLNACHEAGYPRTDDVNGFQQEGFGPFDRNINGGRRWSAARAYLHPVKRRKNLDVICRAMVSRIRFDGKRATGVDVLHGSRQQTIEGAEIICCGGAINSPQLLQLSGIGPARLLRDVGAEVVVDLPGVGQNLQDHLEVYIQHACTQPVSMVPATRWYNKPWVGLRWLLNRSGPAATNHFEAGGFIRSNDQAAYPNVQFHFLPLAIRYDGTAPATNHGYQVHVGPVLSDAVGSVEIRSLDPQQKPALQFNYLSTEKDRREWVECVRAARQILSQPAMTPFSGGELSPGPGVVTDEQILQWVAADAETALHPSCTVKMGLDPMAAVHPDTLRVHGTEGLRVVDASVMPCITNGNIYAPVMMIAEKAADLICGNTPLPAEHVPLYRARA